MFHTQLQRKINSDGPFENLATRKETFENDWHILRQILKAHFSGRFSHFQIFTKTENFSISVESSLARVEASR